MKKLATCEIKNLLMAFSLRGGCSSKIDTDIVAGRGPFMAEAVMVVVLGSFFALSTPSLAQPVERLKVAAIDDVVAGDEGWIIAIDDVAADAGGWITAVDNVTASAGGGIAAYAAEAGGGFAAFGDVASEVRGGIAAFGKVEEELANIAVGIETSIGNVTVGGGFEFDSATDDSESIDDGISVVITELEKETSSEDSNTVVGIGKVFDENGRELFPEDFNINNPATDPGDKTPSSDKTPTSKPDERTVDFPSDKSRENAVIHDVEYNYDEDTPRSAIHALSSGTPKIIQGGEGEFTYYQRDYLEETTAGGKRICVYEHDTKNGDYHLGTSSCNVVGSGIEFGFHSHPSSNVIRNIDMVTSGEIINPPFHPSPYFRKAGIRVDLLIGSRGSGYLALTNNAKISDVDFGIDAYHHGARAGSAYKDLSITNNAEIWNVKKHGIRARLNSDWGSINITLSENIKILNDDSFSDIYMIGGEEHNLVLKDGMILTGVSFGVGKKYFRFNLESKWNVDSGNNQQETFEGSADYGAYTYSLDHEVIEGGNKWTFYRGHLSPVAEAISDQLKDLAAIVVDRIDSVPRDSGGFWAHQNSLRSSDDSVHFGFNTPAMSFMGGGLVVSNSVSPELSASLVEGMSMSNSIGLDYRFDVMGLSVSPQVELAWTRFDFDDFMGPGNTGRVSLEDGDIVTGRLGLLFDGEYIYGGVNLRTAIDGKTALNVSGVSIANEQDELSVDGLLGFSYDWSENYWTYGKVFMSSRGGAEEVRANLGMRIEF